MSLRSLYLSFVHLRAGGSGSGAAAVSEPQFQASAALQLIVGTDRSFKKAEIRMPYAPFTLEIYSEQKRSFIGTWLDFVS